MKIGWHATWALLLLCLWLGLAPQAHAQTDKVVYIYTDPQGTPLVKADAQGNIIARYDYTPYGSSVAALGNSPDGPGYTGHVNDPKTGLVYMQARYYQPIGRFLSPDPVGPNPGNVFDFNRYAYTNNNPSRYTDPDGRCPVCFLVLAGVSLFTTSDYANAPGLKDKPISMSPGEKLSAVAGALPPSRTLSTVRTAINVKDKLSQRGATREAKRSIGIPTSQQAQSQTNGEARDGTKVGRQQTFEVPKPGGGVEQKSVQVSRDVEGLHAGLPQVEAGTVKLGGQLDQAGRPRIQNEGKVRIDFDPNR